MKPAPALCRMSRAATSITMTSPTPSSNRSSRRLPTPLHSEPSPSAYTRHPCCNGLSLLQTCDALLICHHLLLLEVQVCIKVCAQAAVICFVPGQLTPQLSSECYMFHAQCIRCQRSGATALAQVLYGRHHLCEQGLLLQLHVCRLRGAAAGVHRQDAGSV